MADADVRAGGAYIDVDAKLDKFKRDLQGQVGSAVDQSARDTEERYKSSFGHIAKIGAGIVAGVLAGTAILGVTRDVIHEAQESAKVQKLTAAVIKSTGGAARVTQDHVGGLADQLSMLAGIDDEAIAGGENLLLTFTNIRNEVGKGNDIFDQATSTIVDMSAALGQDMKSSAIQLGKALNDPIKGVTALQRVGVSFTADQKKQIKSLVDHGKTLEAQKVILRELGREFGGAAKAAADPEQRLGVVIGNLKEKLGTFLLPIVIKVTDWLGKYLPAALDFATRYILAGVYWAQLLGHAFLAAFSGEGITSDGIVGVAERVGVALRKVYDHVLVPIANFLREHWRGALLIAGALLLGLISPVLLVAAALVYVWTHFETVRDVVHTVVDWLVNTAWPRVQQFIGFIVAKAQAFAAYWSQRWEDIHQAVHNAITAITIFLAPALLALKVLWDTWGQNILEQVKIVFTYIWTFVQGAFRIVKGIFDIFLGLLSGDWSRAWHGVQEVFGGVWDIIVGMLRASRDTVINIVHALVRAVQAAFHGLASLGGHIWDWLSSGLIGVANFVISIVERAINTVIDIVNHLGFDIPDWVPVFGGKHFGLKLDHVHFDRFGGDSSPGSAGAGARGTFGGSFGDGGIVPGPPGAPILIQAHGGEEVVPSHERGARRSITINNYGNPLTPDQLMAWAEREDRLAYAG